MRNHKHLQVKDQKNFKVKSGGCIYFPGGIFLGGIYFVCVCMHTCVWEGEGLFIYFFWGGGYCSQMEGMTDTLTHTDTTNAVQASPDGGL